MCRGVRSKGGVHEAARSPWKGPVDAIVRPSTGAKGRGEAQGVPLGAGVIRRRANQKRLWCWSWDRSEPVTQSVVVMER